MSKSIQIKDSIFEKLKEYKCCGASYSDVIERLMGDNPECSVILAKLKEQQKYREEAKK